MITSPKDIQDIFAKYAKETTREIGGVEVACSWIPDYGDGSPMDQFCAEVYREFQQCSELAELKERVLNLEKLEFERSKNS